MRCLAAVTIAMTLFASASGQIGDKGKEVRRYGVELDTKRFPQNTPKDALGSALKAIGEKQFDYLLAHLADPAFVDKQVAVQLGLLPAGLNEEQKRSQAFDRVVLTITDNFQKDPSKLQELQRFYKDGVWEESGKDAVAQLKNVEAHKVTMTQIPPDRWVLQDRAK